MWCFIWRVHLLWNTFLFEWQQLLSWAFTNVGIVLNDFLQIVCNDFILVFTYRLLYILYLWISFTFQLLIIPLWRISLTILFYLAKPSLAFSSLDRGFYVIETILRQIVLRCIWLVLMCVLGNFIFSTRSGEGWASKHIHPTTNHQLSY